jgi:hypothetical protein
MMGNTVKFRVPIMHDGKYSQISCFYDARWVFLIGKTDCIHIATYTLVCCGLTVLTLFITLVYKYKIQQFICK